MKVFERVTIAIIIIIAFFLLIDYEEADSEARESFCPHCKGSYTNNLKLVD